MACLCVHGASWGLCNGGLQHDLLVLQVVAEAEYTLPPCMPCARNDMYICRAPEGLYEGGLQRDLFLPFIDRLSRETRVHNISSSIDYRRLAHHSQVCSPHEWLLNKYQFVPTPTLNLSRSAYGIS